MAKLTVRLLTEDEAKADGIAEQSSDDDWGTVTFSSAEQDLREFCRQMGLDFQEEQFMPSVDARTGDEPLIIEPTTSLIVDPREVSLGQGGVTPCDSENG